MPPNRENDSDRDNDSNRDNDSDTLHVTPQSNVAQPEDELFEQNWQPLKSLRNKHATNLIIGFLNINSVRNKYLNLCDIFSQGLVDCFSVIESKLDDSFPDAQFTPSGFSLLRQDYSDTSGGIMTFTRSDIPHSRRLDIEINNENIQSLCLELLINKEKWIINSVYRLPSADPQQFWSCMHKMADNMLANSSTIILMGDVNINALCESKAKQINDFTESFSLSQAIRSPTCRKGTPSLIDHLYTNRPKRLSSVLNFDCGLSDYHNVIAVSTKISFPKRPPVVKYYRSFKKFDEKAFLSDIQNAPFQVVDIFTDINDAYWAFDYLLRDVVDQHAPLKKKFIKHTNAPFMNSALRKCMYQKRVAHNKARRDPQNSKKWEDFRVKRNKFVSLKRESMKTYFKERCADGPQSKKLWTTLRPYFSNKNSANECLALRENEEIITSPNSIADVFGNYFSSITDSIGMNENFVGNTDLTSRISVFEEHPSVSLIRQENSDRFFTFRAVTAKDVARTLRNINPKKATGFDQFPPKLLKIASAELTLPITSLVNSIITAKTFPSDFKKAEISPIFKSKDKYDKCNFRPISVLPSLSIITERLINAQIQTFSDDVLHVNISAYRKSYNTQCVAIKAIEDWKLSLDMGQYTAAISTDLSKAFDVLPHGLLLAKLSAYGFDIDSLKLLNNYLSDRKQRVKVNDSKSQWYSIKKGVPQGSVLGPTLFNLFINDIFSFIDNCRLYNYADDNVLSFASSSLSVLKCTLEDDVQNILNWFSRNGMKANPEKFQLVSFGNTLTSIQARNVVISGQDVIKYLGIHVDNKLTFHDHIVKLCSKASKQVNALMRLSHLLDYDTKYLLYKSFICANFDYCPVIWSLCYKSDLSKVCKLQTRALRFVTCDFVSSSDDLLVKCNSQNVTSTCILKIAVEMFKIVKGISPDYLCKLFTPSQNSYSLRNQNPLQLKQPNSTRYGKLSFSFIGVKLWNHLPGYIKEAESLNDFKKLLNEWVPPENVWFYVNRF